METHFLLTFTHCFILYNYLPHFLNILQTFKDFANFFIVSQLLLFFLIICSILAHIFYLRVNQKQQYGWPCFRYLIIINFKHFKIKCCKHRAIFITDLVFKKILIVNSIIRFGNNSMNWSVNEGSSCETMSIALSELTEASCLTSNQVIQ